jgi:hypothetical protein
LAFSLIGVAKLAVPDFKHNDVSNVLPQNNKKSIQTVNRIPKLIYILNLFSVFKENFTFFKKDFYFLKKSFAINQNFIIFVSG